jgi:geranylgeranyl pyrophosphate synthase
VSDEFAEMKGGLGQDMTEGKRTLMVIRTLEKAEPNDRKRLLEILNMHTTDQRLRDEAINIIRDYGSIEYAKNYAQRIVSESWKDVDEVLSSSQAKEKLKAFADYLIERKI